jgi:hypothetical protein
MNSVSRLNEISQQNGDAYPTYEFSFENHLYLCVCNFKGKFVCGQSSPNKRDAKESAATAMLTTVSNVMIVAFDPTPLWNGATEIPLVLKKNGEEKHFVLRT